MTIAFIVGAPDSAIEVVNRADTAANAASDISFVVIRTMNVTKPRASDG